MSGAVPVMKRGRAQRLPDHSPPGKCLRATVDGGTLKRRGSALAWDAHRHDELALDAGSLTSFT